MSSKWNNIRALLTFRKVVSINYDQINVKSTVELEEKIHIMDAGYP